MTHKEKAQLDKYLQKRKNYLAYKYGLTLEDFYAILDDQDDECAVCGATCPHHVDHCHRTGKIRGILCRACNTGLGHFKDNPWILDSAARYLRLHGAY